LYWRKQLPFILLVAALFTACAPGATPGAPPLSGQAGTLSTASASAANSISIELTARNDAFDSGTITVPAGSNVSIIFTNEDAEIPHNVAIYRELPGGQTRPVFIGQTIVGPASINYTFTAPSAAGKYFFECDVHPDKMSGDFIITQ